MSECPASQSALVIDSAGLDALNRALAADGRRVIGPVVGGALPERRALSGS